MMDERGFEGIHRTLRQVGEALELHLDDARRTADSSYTEPILGAMSGVSLAQSRIEVLLARIQNAKADTPA